MIIVNPQDLTPVLAALRNELKADMDAMTSNVQNANTALADAVAGSNQAVQQSLNDLSVVNGEISTEVQAINTHTTTKVDEIAAALAASENTVVNAVSTKSAIKAIHRVSTTGNATVTIPAVNLSKTVVNVLSCSYISAYSAGSSTSSGTKAGSTHAKMISETKLEVVGMVQYSYGGSYSSEIPVNMEIEVIEYA